MIDPTLSTYSDVLYRAALVVYILALAVSLYYYGQASIVSERRRQRADKLALGAEESSLPEELDKELLVKRILRSEKFGGITQAMIWLGVALHAAHVIMRGLATSRFPWGNLFEYVSVVTLVGMLLAVAVIRRDAWRVMWPWVLTPVVVLLFYAGFELYAETAPVVPSLKSPWFVIHVSTVSIGGGIGLLSGMASIIYLVRRAYPEGTRRDPDVIGFRAKFKNAMIMIASPMPSPEKLDALAYRCAVWALPIFGLGVIFGAIWAHEAWGRAWGWDPKETISLVTWLLYAAYLHARATPGWRVVSAWINVVAFATMVFNLFFINIVVSGLHSYAGLN